jgi:hypothetical protein
MKNKLSTIIAFVILASVGIGCGSIGSRSKETGNAGANTSGTNESDKSLTNSPERSTSDKVVDNTVGKSTIGVPECDELMDLIEAELKNPDDNILVKAGKATFFNRLKDGIRESFEKKKQDTTELTKTCKEFRTQFDKYKTEEQSKRQEQ